jgi:hypothetical protein
MLSISGDAKIYCLKPVDLSKGFDLLAASVEDLFSSWVFF